MKIYLITYKEYGNIKYCYSSDFINYYIDRKLKTIIKLEKQFYEKMQQVQKAKGL